MSFKHSPGGTQALLESGDRYLTGAATVGEGQRGGGAGTHDEDFNFGEDGNSVDEQRGVQAIHGGTSQVCAGRSDRTARVGTAEPKTHGVRAPRLQEGVADMWNDSA